MLLLVMAAELNDFSRSSLSVALQKASHACVDIFAITIDGFETRARNQPTFGRGWRTPIKS